MRKPKMTEAQDRARDKRTGVREGSPRDRALDRKAGVSDRTPKRGRKGY